MSTADAYALASVGVDFRVAEAVDAVQMVYGAIPGASSSRIRSTGRTAETA
jgi:acetamidase/formamidase